MNFQYNIGINQKAVLDNNLDMELADVAIMDFFWDYQNANKIEKLEGGWFWASNAEVIRQMPLLGIKTVGGLAKRMDKLVALGLIERHSDNKAMRKSFYRITEKYTSLFRFAHSARMEHSLPADGVTHSQRMEDYNTNNYNTNQDSVKEVIAIEDLELILKYWNEIKPNKAYSNTSIKYDKAILSTCRKITEPVAKLLRKHIKEYGKDEVIYGIDQYVQEIIGRIPNNGTYHEHRFSFHAFLKQGNGLLDFMTRDEKITFKSNQKEQCPELTSQSTTQGVEEYQSPLRKALAAKIALMNSTEKDTESTAQ